MWETGPQHRNSGHGKKALLRNCMHHYHLLPHGCIQVLIFCAHPLSIARHDACGTAIMASNSDFRHMHAGAAAASQKSAACHFCQLQLPLARRKHAATARGGRNLFHESNHGRRGEHVQIAAPHVGSCVLALDACRRCLAAHALSRAISSIEASSDFVGLRATTPRTKGEDTESRQEALRSPPR